MDPNHSSTSPLAGLPAACHALLEAKAKSGLTFEQISEKLGKPEVWTAALFYGQAKVRICSLAGVFPLLPRLAVQELLLTSTTTTPHLHPPLFTSPPLLPVCSQTNKPSPPSPKSSPSTQQPSNPASAAHTRFTEVKHGRGHPRYVLRTSLSSFCPYDFLFHSLSLVWRRGFHLPELEN